MTPSISTRPMAPKPLVRRLFVLNARLLTSALPTPSSTRSLTGFGEATRPWSAVEYCGNRGRGMRPEFVRFQVLSEWVEALTADPQTSALLLGRASYLLNEAFQAWLAVRTPEES